MPYLVRERGFVVYIVSGGGVEFMRPWTERVYGIPPSAYDRQSSIGRLDKALDEATAKGWTVVDMTKGKRVFPFE